MGALELLWLIPALPLAGFIALAASAGRGSKRFVAFVGVGSVGLSALVATVVGIAFLAAPPVGHVYVQTLWTWIGADGFTPKIAFYLDGLSLVMIEVVTWVGFLIHLYSAEFMRDDEGYARFFAYMNLFVAAMLTLVLADNLLFLYLGWEGVGLCSYLLIGFWYRDPVNGRAARKAFIVTRIGDVAMTIGLLLLFTHLGTLDIQTLMSRAAAQWPVGSALAIAAALLLLGGAVGKSAQLPLQTWLPDAMAGPTPVSALIHAATMVTAGVYLIARTHVLYTLAPQVELTVAIIGAVTLLLAGFSALGQTDIKRILAYSTISQIGYMFLALGVGAWSAAIFHFMTHAFFKALLFLAAGVVIRGLDHEHDIFKMGDLRRRLPAAFWSFLIGAASLAALPLVTAGFYSKDLILWETWASPRGSVLLWAAGLVGAFVTAVYIFRPVFIAFLGAAKTPVSKRPGAAMLIPLTVLSVLSIAGGWIEPPPYLGHVRWLAQVTQTALPATAPAAGAPSESGLGIISAVVALAGVYLAYVAFGRAPSPAPRPSTGLRRVFHAGFGFDALYDRLFLRPYLVLSHINRNDFIDAFYDGVGWVSRVFHAALSATQTGQVRWYAAGIAGGAVIVLALAVFA